MAATETAPRSTPARRTGRWVVLDAALVAGIAAALVMAASLLTPVKPVDGGAIASAGGTAAGLTGIALAALLALGLV